MKTNTYRTPLALRSSASRWKKHLASWKTYALAGGASLAAGTNADAQIVHTEVNQTISNNSSFKFSIAGREVTAKVSLAATTYGFQIHGLAKLQGAGISFGRDYGNAKNYAAGAPMGVSANTLAHAENVRSATQNIGSGWFRSFGQFGAIGTNSKRAGTVEGFNGFQLASANHDLGWLRVEVGPASSTTAGMTLTIIDYAYNSSGGPINAGQTSSVPEPGTMALALLAAGAAGVASIRRARARAAGKGGASAGPATEAPQSAYSS
jgi:hypothetical protein